jgi:hypothetical protein
MMRRSGRPRYWTLDASRSEHATSFVIRGDLCADETEVHSLETIIYIDEEGVVLFAPLLFATGFSSLDWKLSHLDPRLF